ncbi:hypothetical protein RhiirB3_532696 [Rhizophagus irregularis]|nr:hypothetical protein RhiirB3_532696 [Rhizophagus irregularis]
MPISNIEENFKLARNALLDFDKKDIIRENSKEEVTAEETGPREIVVFYDVTLEKYHQKFLQEHRRFSVYVRLVKGKVIAYEIPSPPHASLVADLIPILAGWTNRLKIYAELDMIVGNENDTVNCADIVIEPRHVPAPGTGYVPRPRMIIEQSCSSSKFGTKSAKPPPNTPPTVPMTNTIPNLVISFGTAPLHQVSRTFINNIGVRNDRIIGYLQNNDPACVAPGMANYQINIPSHLLFQGYPGGVPHEIPNNFTLDLWNVQQYIFDKLIYNGFELKLNSLRINVF